MTIRVALRAVGHAFGGSSIARLFLTMAITGSIVGCGTATEAETGGNDEPLVASADALSGGSVTVGASLVTTASVNLRAAASTSSAVVIAVPAGARVTALEAWPTSGFYQVAYEGSRGWAYGAYLSGGGGSASGGGRTPGGSSGSGGRTYSGATMHWQGDWNFLTACDAYSRTNGVVFACDPSPSRSFVDNGAWIAMPGTMFSTGLCGRSARVCSGGQCVTARVVEKSETSYDWEGSTAVMNGLGVRVASNGCKDSDGSAYDVDITLY